MARTIADYIDLMTHALGKTPDARHDLYATFNDAGRELFNCAKTPPHFHSWTWLDLGMQSFVVPPGVDYFTLPSTWETLSSIGYPSSRTQRVVVTTVQEIHRLRQEQIPVPTLMIFVALNDSRPRAVSTKGSPRILEIWPQLTAETTLQAVATRRWVPVDAQDGENTADIPEEWEYLLVLLARKKAAELENQRAPFEATVVPAEIGRLVYLDSSRQPEVGSSTYSVMTAATGGGRYYPHRRITR